MTEQEQKPSSETQEWVFKRFSKIHSIMLHNCGKSIGLVCPVDIENNLDKTVFICAYCKKQVPENLVTIWKLL